MSLLKHSEADKMLNNPRQGGLYYWSVDDRETGKFKGFITTPRANRRDAFAICRENNVSLYGVCFRTPKRWIK